MKMDNKRILKIEGKHTHTQFSITESSLLAQHDLRRFISESSLAVT